MRRLGAEVGPSRRLPLGRATFNRMAGRHRVWLGRKPGPTTSVVTGSYKLPRRSLGARLLNGPRSLLVPVNGGLWPVSGILRRRNGWATAPGLLPRTTFYWIDCRRKRPFPGDLLPRRCSARSWQGPGTPGQCPGSAPAGIRGSLVQIAESYRPGPPNWH